MKYTNLAVEFLVIGFIFSLTALFFFMIVIGDFNVSDLKSFFDALKPHWYILIGFFFYINGLVIHRSLAILNYNSVRYLLAIKFFRFFFTRSFITKVESINIDDHWNRYYFIHEHASSSSIEKLNFFEKKLAIYKALTILLPVLSLLGFYWLYMAKGLSIALIFSLPAFVFTFLSGLSYFLLKHVYVKFMIY